MRPESMPKYDFRFTSMADFATAHQEELREWQANMPPIPSSPIRAPHSFRRLS
jgi:hypothetical protein